MKKKVATPQGDDIKYNNNAVIDTLRGTISQVIKIVLYGIMRFEINTNINTTAVQSN